MSIYFRFMLIQLILQQIFISYFVLFCSTFNKNCDKWISKRENGLIFKSTIEWIQATQLILSFVLSVCCCVRIKLFLVKSISNQSASGKTDKK